MRSLVTCKFRIFLFCVLISGGGMGTTLVAQDMTAVGWDDNNSDTAALQDSRPFLAVFGDSVSLAVFADAKLGDPNIRYQLDMIGTMANAAIYKTIIEKIHQAPTEEEQHKSIHRMFKHMARLEYSPYFGIQDYSLPILIQQTTGKFPKIYNGAKLASGYHWGYLDLNDFDTYLRWLSPHRKPDIIIVAYTAMDFIDARGLPDFTASVQSFFQRLAQTAPNSKIVVNDIADPIPLLTYPDRIAVPHSPNGPITCSSLYKQLQFGAKAGIGPESTPEQISAAKMHLGHMRDILHAEIERMNADRNSYPNFTGEAILIPLPGSAVLSPEQVAADCIHPDIDGQRAIGNVIWNTVSTLL